MTKEEIIANIDGSINGERNPKISGDILNNVLKNILNFEASGFINQKTLYVDSNGDDDTAEVGNLNAPWGTVAGAINYLLMRSMQNYTIIVFPGIYAEETTWNFGNSKTDATFNNNNTTILLLGAVNIQSTCNFSILLDNSGADGDALNFNIIGSGPASDVDFSTGALIQSSITNILFNSEATSVENASDINLNIKGISFISSEDCYHVENGVPNIAYEGYITGKFKIENCVFKNYNCGNWTPVSSREDSFSLWDATIVSKDTYWETNTTNETPNITLWDSTTFQTKVNLFIEDNKFVKKYTYCQGNAHIYTIGYDEGIERVKMILKDCIFYSSNPNNGWVYGHNLYAENTVDHDAAFPVIEIMGSLHYNCANVLSVAYPIGETPVQNLDMQDISLLQK